MSYDILQSIPQGGYGAHDEENRRIQEIADELNRLCRLHEEESGNCKKNGSSLEIEQRVTEQYAKSHNIWIPMDSLFDLGIPGPSGNENDTYVSDNTIFKVINRLMRRPAGTLPHIRVRCTHEQILRIGLGPRPEPQSLSLNTLHLKLFPPKIQKQYKRGQTPFVSFFRLC